MLYYIIAIVVILILYNYYDTGRFEGYKNLNKTVIYWFHRPSCPHCVKMEGEWNKLTKSGLSDTTFELIDVNTADEKNNVLAADYGVESVPHIVKVLPNGKREVYNGSRTATAMKEWVLKK